MQPGIDGAMLRAAAIHADAVRRQIARRL
jgi:hypothetical protein